MSTKGDPHWLRRHSLEPSAWRPQKELSRRFVCLPVCLSASVCLPACLPDWPGKSLLAGPYRQLADSCPNPYRPTPQPGPRPAASQLGARLDQGWQGCWGALTSAPRPAPPSAPGLARASRSPVDPPDLCCPGHPRTGLACSRIGFRRRAPRAARVQYRVPACGYARRANARARHGTRRHAAG